MRISLTDLTKRFEDNLVLDHVNMEIREHEFLGLLGPSGSGKTTLLRILAGLEVADSGTLMINDQDAFLLPLVERQIGFVFQHYALFEHMSVYENVAFGLRVQPRRHRLTGEAIRKRVEELLELVKLEEMHRRFPFQLSGGQRQRVAVARALATRPKILLLDEPFGALDAKVRVELRRALRDIHDATKLTTVFVTHDQDEALDLADRVAVINRGKIEQIGTPSEIYEQPKTAFVFDFLGRTNSFDCEITNGSAKIGDTLVKADLQIPDGPAVAFVRPDHIVLLKEGAAPPEESVILPKTAIVRFLSALGSRASVELLYNRQLLQCELLRDQLKELDIEVGSKCEVAIRYPRIFARQEVEREVPANEGRRSRRFRRRRRR